MFYQLWAENTAEALITDIETSPLVPRVAGTVDAYSRPIRIRQGVRGTFMALRLGNETINKTWSTEVIVGNVVSGRK